MAEKHWRNSYEQRIRSGGSRIYVEDCCCGDCGDWPDCMKSVDWHTYTASADVDWPADVENAYVWCWGPGGAGGEAAADEAGGGGGGGGFAVRTVGKADTSLEIIVNDSANGYKSQIKQNGVSEIYAEPGNAGDDSGDGGGGGVGGGGDAGLLGTVYPGGTGEDGINGEYGGGGGGGADRRGAGGDGIDFEGGIGAGSDAGDGGDGGNAGHTAGYSGANYGGGGGGGFDEGAGGTGGTGRVRIGWWLPIELSLILTGAGDGDFDDGQCLCETGETGACQITVSVTWDNLNGSYTLAQSSPGSNSFTWEAPIADPDDYDDVNTNGLLIVRRLIEGRVGPSDPIIPVQEEEYYIIDLNVQLTCTDGRVTVGGISHGTMLLMQRAWNGSDWDPWENMGGTDVWGTSLASTTDWNSATACADNVRLTGTANWGAIAQNEASPCDWNFDHYVTGTAIVEVLSYED